MLGIRALAAAFFVCAAFSWPTWVVDRAGLAALGFACLAFTVGRVLPPARPTDASEPADPFAMLAPDIEATVRDLQERLGAYGAGGRTEPGL
jgi:hypothetical protein